MATAASLPGPRKAAIALLSLDEELASQVLSKMSLGDVRRLCEAVEHLGETRATRYLRKFYPWYVTRLELDVHEAKRLQAALQQSETLTAVRALLQEHTTPLALAV